MKFEIFQRFIVLLSFLIIGHSAVAGDEFIENVSVSSGDDEALITWNIRYDSLPTKRKLIIRYAENNLAKVTTKPAWKYTKILDPSVTSYTLKNLISSEKYAVSVGVFPMGKASMNEVRSNAMIWSEEKLLETNHSWAFGSGLIIQILMLLGALALFIYGMIVMSEGIQKAAGQRLRQILGTITKNRLKGILTGFLTTAIIQSSSATTVMVVSFVNAGLLNLRQSIGVIMGANIGTTITAWIVAFLGFSLDMSDYALPIMLVALIMYFSKRGSTKAWGEVLIGFALLFIGLEMLKVGVPDLKDIGSLEFLNGLSGHGIFSLLIFILIGTVVTIIVQSSSAAMAVTILLCEGGIIPFEMAAGMVLGENIGTTITANIAAIVANVHAKRAARSHFVFNVIGVAWMIIVFDWFFLDMIDYIVGKSFASPYEHQEARPIALALFHTMFNIMNVFILVWFTDYIVKIVTWMVPSKTTNDEKFHLDYISGGLLKTPELFLLEAQKELAKFGKITARMSKFTQELMFEQDGKKRKTLISKIGRYEEITDSVEEEISRYLNECAVNELSSDSLMKVRSMLAVTSELERIGDIFYQMSLTYKRKNDERIWFTPDQRSNVKAMLEVVDEAFEVMIVNLNKPYEAVTITEALEKERKLNKMRDKFKKRHLATIEDDAFNIKSATVYTDLIYSCERVGDHIINVTESLIRQTVVGED